MKEMPLRIYNNLNNILSFASKLILILLYCYTFNSVRENILLLILFYIKATFYPQHQQLSLKS